MKSSLKKKWIAALRSGEYVQTAGYLCRIKKEQKSFCCLGVLCDVIDPANWIQTEEHTEVSYLGTHDIYELPPAMADHHGLTHTLRVPVLDRDGNFSYEEMKTIDRILMHMNDEEEKSFDEIADWVEENVPEEDDEEGLLI